MCPGNTYHGGHIKKCYTSTLVQTTQLSPCYYHDRISKGCASTGAPLIGAVLQTACTFSLEYNYQNHATLLYYAGKVACILMIIAVYNYVYFQHHLFCVKK